ncbi:uncharacterized protein STEHIDRAFT_164095 [Stereum hirsutum FP-91666 SS1]|uniref:Uncharacterized protein n=1 Tax=Stereum hirsutum (strain FP-91666) TaxID=721885 RepID=R7RVH5_STEHR|nr:uncharacterized protein STEHIDRAFT_164095 [Stereum hirsutum FP-91666 SS1]EIM79014.1 hypothetical protein STEHIDRAFT_164095 [Stereum hirsutum FP-91666 SS1]
MTTSRMMKAEDAGGDLRELEDAAAEVDLSFGYQGQPAGLPTFSRMISVGGIIMNKAHALAQHFKYKKSAASTDRLRRVKDEAFYAAKESSGFYDA